MPISTLMVGFDLNNEVPNYKIINICLINLLTDLFVVVDETKPTWAAVLMIMQPVVPRQPPVESVLVAEGRVLALYAILLKRLPSCRDIREEGMLLTNLIDWITAIKPTLV